MRIPQLRMESVMGRIGMQTNNARQSIEQPQAVLEIEQPSAEMTIEKTPARLTIDQTQAKEQLGFKSLPRLMEEFALEGRQGAQEGAGRRAEEGRELVRIENAGNPLPSIAKQNSERPEKFFNIGFIPSYFSVKLDFEPAKLHMDWKQNKPIIDVQPQKPIVGYEPGNVDIYMQQYPELNIDVIDIEV